MANTYNMRQPDDPDSFRDGNGVFGVGLLYTRQIRENRAWEIGLHLQRRTLSAMPSNSSGLVLNGTTFFFPFRYLIGGPSARAVRSGKNGGVYLGGALRYSVYEQVRDGGSSIRDIRENFSGRLVPGLLIGARTAARVLSLGFELELGLASASTRPKFNEIGLGVTLGYVFSY